MSASSYGSTHGASEREPRSLMERLLVYSLADQIARLRNEQEWLDGGHNSVTLAKEVDFRVVLSLLREGGTPLHEDHGDARTSIQLLEGSAALSVDGEVTELDAGQLATIDMGHAWRLEPHGECAVLLTIAWPREKAGV